MYFNKKNSGLNKILGANIKKLGRIAPECPLHWGYGHGWLQVLIDMCD